MGACRYQSVKSILKNSLDAVPSVAPPPSSPPPPHDNIRGAEYFDWGDTAMLKQPIIEKLLAMRLHGMAESLKAQEQDPATRELSFHDRLGLLVDQQWNWRGNQALGRRLKNAKLRTNACVEEIDFRGARCLDKSVTRALAQESGWIGTHENVFVLGPTGVGQSFVACALAQKACRDGYSALYTRGQALFRDLGMARADGSLRNLLARLSRIDVFGDRRFIEYAGHRDDLEKISLGV
jgi:DNA replication protein DnaC